MDGIHGYIQAPAGFLKTPEWFWPNVLELVCPQVFSDLPVEEQQILQLLWVLIQRSVSRVTASGLGLAWRLF